MASMHIRSQKFRSSGVIYLLILVITLRMLRKGLKQT